MVDDFRSLAKKGKALRKAKINAQYVHSLPQSGKMRGVKPSDFFTEEEDPQWEIKGLDPWTATIQVFNVGLVEQLRTSPQDGIGDLDAAYGLTQLARDELVAYGTDSSNRFNDEEISVVLRALRAICRRLGIDFDLPFRDFTGFHGYWSSHDMSGAGGWAARRGYVNELLNPVLSRLEQLEDAQASTSVRGVDGQLKNIIFASTGLKPRIVLRDAINNVVEVVENEEYCLFYDRPLSEAGLTWAELVDWWGMVSGLGGQDAAVVARGLYRRLAASLGSRPEKTLFRTYCERYGSASTGLPALLPQVYLHYDPRTRRERDGQPGVLMRERMDFLLLLPRGVRIVVEVDGQQHYAVGVNKGDAASPRLYSEMVAEDRRLRLRGYEVYRFGGYELTGRGAADMLREFFDELLARYEAD